MTEKYDELKAAVLSQQYAAASDPQWTHEAIVAFAQATAMIADAVEDRPPDPPEGPRCADCGCLLNAGEAKAFTCCDDCWRKAYPPEAEP